MTKYTNLIYPEDKKNNYPEKLYRYLFKNFIKTPGKILDVGCGKGVSLYFFNKFGMETYGIDKREEEQEHFHFRGCDIEKEGIPFEDGVFDVVYSKSVIEHVLNTENFLQEILRVLKPGGMFICLTPDWRSQMKNFWDDYTHVKAFTRKSLRDALIINGFNSADCDLFYQLPFVWKNKKLEIIPKIISLCPDSWKWKNKEERNTKDRKLIRFSKEKMLLAWGIK
jgi:SAM-dependent methyltransferase